MNVLYRNKELYPQIDEPFRCVDIYNRKASVPLWVHPFRVTKKPRVLCCTRVVLT